MTPPPKKEPLLSITGRIIEEAQTAAEAVTGIIVTDNAAAEANQTNETQPEPPQNETQPPQQPAVNKSITAKLAYNSRTPFDTNDDGIETEKEAIDFTTSETQFNWQADENKLCTRWKTESPETNKEATICNGNTNCCLLIELTPTAESWKEPFTITYGGLNGAVGYTNNVSAQVIYANYNLETPDSNVDVAYSEWQTLPATFLKVTEFKAKCEETCSLPLQPNQTRNATILIELEDNNANTILTLQSISYTATVSVNNPPTATPIPAITIKKNTVAIINLSQYFNDEEGDKLTFTAASSNNNIITSITRKEIAVIETKHDYTGTSTATFTASDGTAETTTTTKITVADTNNAPQLLKQIENITITQSKPATLNLANYFTDADNDTLTYEAFKAEGITTTITRAEATITPDKDFTGRTYTYITATDTEGAIAISNVFQITVTTPAEKEETQQLLEKIEINKPAKWRKTIKLTEEGNTTTSIPAEATAITVKENNTNIEDHVKVEQKGKASKKLRQHNKEQQPTTTTATDVTSIETTETPTTEQNITLIIEENATLIQVEYETPAPTAQETEISSSTKQITITSNFHYENITAYTTLQTEAPPEAVKLYWLKKVKKQPAGSEITLSPSEAPHSEAAEEIRKIVSGKAAEKQPLAHEISFKSSEVAKITTLPCFLNAFSSDQTEQLLARAKAKYGSSFTPLPCGEIVLASDKNFSYSLLGTVPTDFSIRENSVENSTSEMPAKLLIFSLSYNNSLKAYSGEISSQPASNNTSITCLLAESALKNENNTLASTISISGNILDQQAYSLCRLATLSLSSPANLSACSSVNFDLDSISSATENSSRLTNCVTTLPSADSKLPFNSGAMPTFTTTSAMPTSPQQSNQAAYLKLSHTWPAEAPLSAPAQQMIKLLSNDLQKPASNSEISFEKPATLTVEAASLDATPAEAEEITEKVLVEGVVKTDTDGNGLIDRIEWTVPSLSSQTYEVEITILNPYTYLRDGETWTVAFNTTGIANLTINSTNANWTEIPVDDQTTTDEMQFLNISCGLQSITESLTIKDNNNHYNYTQLNQTSPIKPKHFTINNYTCSETSYFTNQMHKAGYATLMLTYGSQTAYAYDPVKKALDKTESVITLNASTAPSLENVQIRVKGENFSFNYNNAEFLTLQPVVIYKNSAYTLKDVKTAMPDLKLAHILKNTSRDKKFAANFSKIPSSVIDDVNAIGLKVTKGWENLTIIQDPGVQEVWTTGNETTTETLNDTGQLINETVTVNQTLISTTNTITGIRAIADNGLILDFKDLIENNFTIQTDYENKQFLISNIKNNYNTLLQTLLLDPTIQSSCGTLNTANTEYQLTENMASSGTCFTIAADNITLDCQGYRILYANDTAGNGIDITGYNSTTVKNCIMQQINRSVQQTAAIYASLSNSSVFTNNTINTTGNYSLGIELQKANYTNITSNTINTTANFSYGISLLMSSPTNITSNTITTRGTSAYGINLTRSSKNLLQSNTITITGSSYGILVNTLSNNNVMTSNTINTTQVGILMSQTNNKNNITSNTITTTGSSSNSEAIKISVSFNDISDSTGENNITGNTITTTGSGSEGIEIDISSGGSGKNSNNNRITSNTIIIRGSANGILLTAATTGSDSSNTIAGNTITTTIGNGINLDGNTGTNIMTGNNITGNTINTTTGNGILLGADGSGNSLSNTIMATNTITTTGANGHGISITSATSGGVSKNNIVKDNTITTTGASANGIHLSSSINGYSGIENNNIIGNTINTTGASAQGISITKITYTGIKNSTDTINNTITTTGRDASGISALMSNFNNITGNNITTFGNASIGINITKSNMSIVTDNRVITTGNLSFAVQIIGISINNSIYNNIFNTTAIHVNVTDTRYTNWFNTSKTAGANIWGGISIGGNLYANSTGDRNTISYTCTDTDNDEVCDTSISHADNNTDYLPLLAVNLVSECQQLSTTNATYALTQNISSEATCISITASNTTLQCRQYTLSYANFSTGYGINVTAANFTTIRNCAVLQGNFTTTNSHAILLSSSNSNNITKNNITTTGNSSFGILLQQSNSSTFSNNNIKTTGNFSFAVQLESSSANNTIYNNIFNTTEKPVNTTGTAQTNWFNTSKTAGTNIISGANLGGNFYDNSTPNGKQTFAETCADTDNDDICDTAITHAANNIDYLPLTTHDYIPVGYCQQLDTANARYKLTQDLSSESTCINITAPMITLDCQGYSISYANLTTGHAINITSVNSTKITNCIIIQANITVANAHGIYAIRSNNTIITTNIINTTGAQSSAIELLNSRYANISGNGLNVSNSSTSSLTLKASNYNNITQNNITTMSNSSFGILIRGSNSSTFTNNNIKTTGNLSFAIQIEPSSTNNTIYNNIFNTTEKPVNVTDTIQTNWFNTSKTAGTNIIGAPTIGGNFYANSTEGGQKPISYTCTDSDWDYICDTAVTHSGNNTDALPLIITMPVNSCQQLTVQNMSYALTQSLATEGTCINVTAHNTRLDCNGYTISYANLTAGYGINITGINSTAIKNCILLQTNTTVTPSSAGILAIRSNNSIITNNNINTTGSYSLGIELRNSNFTNVTGNYINTTATFSYGISMLTSTFSNVTENTILTKGTNAYGINLTSSSNNNLLQGNTISTSGTSSNNYGILFSSSSSGTANSNTINTSGGSGNNYGILFSSSSSGTATSNTINTSGTGGSNTYGIYFSSSSSGTANSNTINTAKTGTGGGSNYGIYFSSSSSGAANSNTVRTSAASSGFNYGIYFSSSTGTATSNTINTSGTGNDYGIYVFSESDKNNITGNTINTSASSSYGIFLEDSGTNDPDFNNVTNNVILTAGTTAHGIYVKTDAENTLVQDNTITTTSTGHGIQVEANINNLITGNNVTTSAANAFGIYVLNAKSSNYTGNIIKTTGAGSFGVQIDNTTTNLAVNNIFTNNIFNTTARHVNITHPSSNYANNFSLTTITSGTNIVGGSNLGGNFYDNSTAGGQKAYSFTCTDADTDTICDTSLTHATNNVDLYPLVAPPFPPRFSNNGSNFTSIKINEVANFSINWTDASGLNFAVLAHNLSGGFVNLTPIALSGTEANISQNFTINLSRGKVFGIIWHANDTDGVSKATNPALYEVANTLPNTPSISLPVGVQTQTNFSVNYTSGSDADGDTITYYIFLNNTLNKTATINTTINLSDGSWTLNVSAYDGVGFSSNSTVGFEVYTRKPHVNFSMVTESNDTAANRQWIFVNVTITEANISNITFSLYNFSALTTVNTTVFNNTNTRTINYTGLALNQIYYYNVTVFNNLSLSNSTENRFMRLDSLIPSMVNLTNPQNNSITSANVNFTWQAIDALSVPMTCNLKINETVNVSAVTTQNNTATNYTVTVNKGDYNWSVTCTDRAGNENSSQTFVFSVDFQPPDVTIITPLNATFANSAKINFTFTASDRTGIANCSLYHNATGQYTLNQTNNSMQQNTNTTFNLSSVPDLQIAWALHCADTVTPEANAGFNNNFTLTIDTTPPNIANATNINPAGFRNVNWTFINYSFTDLNNNTVYIRNNSAGTTHNTTPNQNTGYFQRNFTNLNNANYTYSGWINDSAGWTNETAATAITIDTTLPAPKFGLGPDANGSYVNRNYASINITVSELYSRNLTTTLWSGTTLTALQNNSFNTTPLSNNITFQSVSDGQYNISATVADMAGNTNTTTANLTITVDTTLPAAFTLSTPDNRTITTNTTPTLTWTATTDSNFANYTLQVSNYSDFNIINYTYYALAAVSNTSLVPSTALTNDTYWYWRATAYDLAGNSRTATTLLYITDSTPPLFNITATNPSEFIFENATINWTINELHLNYSYINITYTNNTLIKQLTTNSTFNTTGLAIGNYTLVGFAIDNATNENTTRLNITVRDTTPPGAFSLTSPGTNTVSKNQSPTLDWQDTEEAMLANYTIQITNSSSFSYVNYTFNSTVSAINISVSLASEMTWYWRVSAFDTAGNSRISTEAFSYTPDVTAPVIASEARTPDVVYTNTSVTVNATITDSRIATITLEGNWTGSLANITAINNTGSVYNYTISGTELANLEVIQWRFYANDSGGNAAQGTLQTFTVTNRPPDTVNLTRPVNESEQLDTNINFTWTTATDNDTDTVTYQLLIDDSAALESPELNATGLTTTSYLSTSNLTAGLRYWNVRSYDGNNYSAFTGIRTVTVLQARINTTNPANNTAAYPGDNITFNVEELNETEWINHINLTIRGTNYTMMNITNTTWQYNYTVENVSAQVIAITAYAYNQTMNTTAKAYLSFIVLKSAPRLPVINTLCSNETYALNNTNTTIQVTSTLDTLLQQVNTSITAPDNSSSQPAFQSNSSTGTVYHYNYTYRVALTGTYSLHANVTDTANQTARASSTFYVVNETKTVSINQTGINITIQDTCTGNTARAGNLITIPANARYTIQAETALPTITFKEANLTGNITTIANYTDIGKNLTAPTGTTTLAQFELNTSLTDFGIAFITYNYTAVESAITNEDSMSMYRCANTSNCNYQQLNTTVNTTANILTANTTNFSAFIITEELRQTTNTITTTTTSSGGGGSAAKLIKENITQYISLDIITPTTVSLYMNETIIAPIEVINRGNITLNEISLTAKSNSSDIEPRLTKDFINQLKVGEKESLDLRLGSHSIPGRYEVTVTAKVKEPDFEDSTKFFIDLVDRYIANRTVIIERVKFAKDLFKENPECLEIQSVLEGAEAALGSGQYEKSAKMTEQAINACKDLITSLSRQKRTETVKPAGKAVIILLTIISSLLLLLFLLEAATHFVGRAGRVASRAASLFRRRKKGGKKKQKNKKNNKKANQNS